MNHRHAYLLLIATALFWGGNAIAGKLAIGHISPMMLTFLRWLVAFVVLVIIGRDHLRRDWPTIRQNWRYLFMLGALGFAAFNIGLYSALSYTTAINVSIEQAGMPMLIFLLNFLFFRQRAAALQIVGLVLSIAGVVLTASHGDPARLLALDLNIGDAIMLGSVIVYAIYSVALRFKPALHWMSLMIALCAAASIATIPFLFAEHAAGQLIAPDLRGWLILLYVAIFPSILSQIFYIRGIELIGANRASLFVNLVPVFGTLLSIVILGEKFEFYHVLALGLVFGGIWLAEASGKRQASLPPAR